MHSSSLLSIVCFTLVATTVARCGETGRKFGVGRELKQASRGCVVENGIDYVNDMPLNDGYTTIVETPEECCELCMDFKGCERWVMIMAKTRYHNKGECWLKDANVERTNCIVCAGGVNPNPKPKPEPEPKPKPEDSLARSLVGCLELPGVDFKGGDLFGVGIPTDSDDECCELCQQNTSCKAWTRTKAGECWIKDVQNDMSICRDCSASGIIKSRQSSSDLRSLNEVLRLLKKNPTISPPLEQAINDFVNSATALEGDK